MKSIELVLSSLNISKDPKLVSSLQTYAEELIKWNRKINLTGASTSEEFIKGPLYDSLTVLTVIEKKGSLVDVGSGGGLPGIPISLAIPGLEVTLVEPRSKRASFLRHIVHRLGLEAQILEAREDKLPSGGFEGAVAQAVWPQAVWLDLSLRLVKKGGALYVLSKKPLEKGSFPDGTSLDREVICKRPFDGKKRCATRIRVLATQNTIKEE